MGRIPDRRGRRGRLRRRPAGVRQPFHEFPSFIAHLSLIIQFQLGFGAKQVTALVGSSCGQYAGLCPTDRSLVPHIISSGIPVTPIIASNCVTCWTSTNPLDWLTYFPPVISPTALVLAPNYPLVWLGFVWIPVAARSFRSLRLTGEGRALLLALSIFGWNIGSDLWIYAGLGRAVFEWYLLPAVPAFGSLVLVGLLLSPMVFHQLYPQPQPCSNC